MQRNQLTKYKLIKKINSKFLRWELTSTYIYYKENI